MNSSSRLLWLFVWIGLAIYVVLTLWWGLVGMVYPYQLDYGEGIVLWFTRELARGHSIYKGLTGYPYASSNYPPVAMLLAATLMPIFGDGYAEGRLLNFASALIVAMLIYRIVRAETRDDSRSICHSERSEESRLANTRPFAPLRVTEWAERLPRDVRAGALAALFFIGSPYVYHWIPLFRVDLIGLAFAFGGVYLVWLWDADRRRQTADRRSSAFYFCLFTFGFLLALYTKHTLFAAPVAAFLAIFQRDRRVAIAFALALGITGGAIYLAMDYATRGGFAFGLIESNATVFLPGQLLALLRNFATTFPVLLLLALWGWLARVRARQAGVLEWYAAISFAALVMAGRVGAWENYFFEALAVMCVFAIQNSKFGIRNSELPIRISNFELRITNLAFPILLLVQLLLARHDPRIAVDLIARDTPANRELTALLTHTPGTIISEDMGALVTSGREVAYYTFQYSSLARSGKWDQSWELNGLREGMFPLAILERGTREDVDHYRRFTREFVSALDRYYARVQTIGKYEVYAPASPLTLQSADFGGLIALVGWHARPETLQPGTLQLSIVWQARCAMDRRYTAFVHLDVARTGDKVTQDDREPRGGIYPTTRWATGEMVREMYTLNVPGGLPADGYVLRVGWYDAETGERLSVPGSADDAVVLTTFEIP